MMHPDAKKIDCKKFTSDTQYFDSLMRYIRSTKSLTPNEKVTLYTQNLPILERYNADCFPETMRYEEFEETLNKRQEAINKLFRLIGKRVDCAKIFNGDYKYVAQELKKRINLEIDGKYFENINAENKLHQDYNTFCHPEMSFKQFSEHAFKSLKDHSGSIVNNVTQMTQSTMNFAVDNMTNSTSTFNPSLMSNGSTTNNKDNTIMIYTFAGIAGICLLGGVLLSLFNKFRNHETKPKEELQIDAYDEINTLDIYMGHDKNVPLPLLPTNKLDDATYLSMDSGRSSGSGSSIH